MTDNEIKKALECCSPKQNRSCGICPAYDLGNFCASELKQNALDLINRQKAEIENLKVENQSLRSAANSLKMHYEEAQAEVERLKRELDLVIENSISARYPHCVLCGNGAILTKSLEEYDELIADISAKAYKEFAERLKKEISAYRRKCRDTGDDEGVFAVDKVRQKIDNIEKEMVGENND